MSYLIVCVSRRANLGYIASSLPTRCAMDGRPLRPGTYASQIKELLPEGPGERRPVRCGYCVILWPMDQHAPLYEAAPLQFGPFESRSRAESFVLEISTEVKPVEVSRPATVVKVAPPELERAGDAWRLARRAG